MEHVHTAGVAGTVSAIDVAEGEQVTTEEDRRDRAAAYCAALADDVAVSDPGRPVPSLSQHAT